MKNFVIIMFVYQFRIRVISSTSYISTFLETFCYRTNSQDLG